MTPLSHRHADDPRDRSPVGTISVGIADIISLLVLLTLAWWLYRPDWMRAVDYVDFPDNALVMAGRDGFVDRYLALTQAYQAHGRWHPVLSAVIVAQWSLFESWTTGWHVVRFVLLSAVTVLAHLLYRRIGLNAIGAASGALLFVVALPAINGWTRLGTAEPLGTLFLLIACHVALDLRTRRAQWILALMGGAVVWSKELIAAALFLPALLAVSAGSNGELSLGRASAARLRRLVPAALILVATAIPVLGVYASADSGAFAKRYGSGPLTLVDVAGTAMIAWLPLAPAPGDVRPAILIGVALLLAAAGWLTAWRTAHRSHSAVILIAAVSLPLIGAIVYAPWPAYVLVYALPFVAGGALLLGQAVSSLSGAGRLDRAVVAICLVPIASFAALHAANASSRTASLHDVVATSVRRVAEARSVDSVVVAVAIEQFDARGNFGPRFPLYARMIGLDWPPVRDATCDEADRIDREGILVLILSEMCPAASRRDTTIVSRHTRYDWPSLMPHQDSVTVAIRGLFVSSSR